MQEVLGIGTDIVEIERIKMAIQRHGKAFLSKIYTPNEQAYCERFSDPSVPYAARFAAKEAIAKALGCGMRPPLTWTALEVSHDALGKPVVALTGELISSLGVKEVMLTMSHCQKYAVAYAIAFR